MHVKKGQTVKILTGKDAGKQGEVVRAFPKADKIVVAGINVMKKHQKPRREGEKGTMVERAMPIHVSNVALADAAPKAAPKKASKAKK